MGSVGALVASIGLSVALVSRRVHIGFSLLSGGVLFALLLGDPLLLARSARSMVGSYLFWHTTLVVALVIAMNSIMEQAGFMRKLLEVLDRIIRWPRVTLITPPALLGLLPMPAGALFAADLSRTTGERIGLSVDEIIYVNYWWRHIWEGFWPLFAAVIMEAGLLKASIGEVSSRQAFILLSMVASGVLLMPPSRRELDRVKDQAGGIRASDLLEIARYTWPLMGVIAGAFLVPLPMWVTLSAVVLALAIKVPRGTISAPKLRKALDPRIFLALVSVFLFKELLYASGAIESTSQLLLGLGLPKALVFFLLPFVVGFATGITVAYVALAFPLLIPLAGGDLTAMAWAFAGGYMGVMSSPMHLCLALTKEYLGGSWGGVYRRLAPSVAVSAALCSLFYVAARGWL